MSERQANTLRGIADYCLYSDMDGREWITLTLRQALRDGHIVDFDVLGSWGGIFGLQHVAFTVDVPCVREWAGFTHEAALKAFTALLSGPVIGDSDVHVRWVAPVFEALDSLDLEVA